MLFDLKNKISPEIGGDFLSLMLGKRQEAGDAGAFDGSSNAPLVFGAVAGAGAGGDFILMG